MKNTEPEALEIKFDDPKDTALGRLPNIVGGSTNKKGITTVEVGEIYNEDDDKIPHPGMLDVVEALKGTRLQVAQLDRERVIAKLEKEQAKFNKRIEAAIARVNRDFPKRRTTKPKTE